MGKNPRICLSAASNAFAFVFAFAFAFAFAFLVVIPKGSAVVFAFAL
jgi:hypothetical protein